MRWIPSFSNNYIQDSCISFWLEYFLDIRDNLVRQDKEDWVDFETEITKLVSRIETIIESEIEGIDSEFATNDLEEIEDYYIKHHFPLTPYREIHDRLLKDLDYLTWLLGYYFSHYVEDIEILPDRSPAIVRELLMSESEDSLVVINFNYTNSLDINNR